MICIIWLFKELKQHFKNINNPEAQERNEIQRPGSKALDSCFEYSNKTDDI